MANGTFFASWELWQQMTFVLAMGIALVFLVGLMKLWWTNRHMKMIEQLDAEKQEQSAQMRRYGLSANKRRSKLGNEIPFGVKALESGAEVDGVWVVRMASMASRPSDKKWSSKRKAKTPVMNIAYDFAGFTRRPSRGSSRAGRITRREIIKPPSQTGKKPGSPPLPEGDLRYSGSAANKRLQISHMDQEEARRPTQEGKGGQTGHTGPLRRIQRSLKKITPSELLIHQQKKRGGGQEAREFRINAEARKPQRFYPQDATLTAPIRGMPSHQSIPQRKSSLHSISNNNSGETKTTGPTRGSGTQQVRLPTTAPRSHESRHRTLRASSNSSVESYTASMEELKEFAPRSQPPPLEHHPVFSSGDQAPVSELTFGRGRSRHSRSQNGHARRSSSEDRSTIHDQQQHDTAVQPAPATALRYPPNSSRSAAYVQPRPQSFNSDQQPRTNGAACSAAQPSPTFGPSDSCVVSPHPGALFFLMSFDHAGAYGETSCRYINTCARKVNSNFEILPAGTFGPLEQHAPERPASTAPSVRSSFDSQRSARKKLQKKRTSSNYSK